MKRTLETNFKLKSIKMHSNTYDYSLVEYVNGRTKVKIICLIHGEFEQTPQSHLNGSGCPKCGFESRINKRKLTFNTFIEKANIIHDNKYDYTNINVLEYKKLSKIICPTHGEFEQTPHSHLSGSGCPKCANVYRYSTDEYIKKSKIIHGERYDYSKVCYNNMYKKINIICKKHGEFKIIPNNHINGQGCPICRESKGEAIIKNLLTENNIKFFRQKRFLDCRDIRPLPFDFYLPDYNICIEYDGRQHYQVVNKWGGMEGLQNQQKKDKIKTEYCDNNNIKLVRIRYDDNINNKIWNII